MIAAVTLLSNITVYCDDYLYGSFFRDGLSGFWKLTKWHYLSFNGRAFVHFAAELVIWADKYIYMFLAPAMLAEVFWLGQRLQDRRVDGGLTAAAAGVCVFAVLALPLRFLRTSILWMSAGFNYLFPLAVILPTLWLLTRDIKRGRLGAGTLVLCFLSGATTEQNGIAAFVILGGYAVLTWLRRENALWKALLVCLVTGVGYLTVIFAPGTWVRVGRETGGGILTVLRPSVLDLRIKQTLSYFTGEWGLPWLFVLFSILVGLDAVLTEGRPKLLCAGFAVGPLYLLLRDSGRLNDATILSLVWFLSVAVIWLLRRETAVRGLLLGGMLASLLVMVFTTVFAERTTFPAILILMTVCASLACGCVKGGFRWTQPAVCAALAALLLVFSLPTFHGYAKNSVIWEENARSFRSRDGIITLDMDVDNEYRHDTYLDSMSYLHNAVTYYGAEGKKITYASSQYKVAGAYASGTAGLPIYEKDGALYVPIQDSITLLGGESDWDFSIGGTWGSLGDRSYILKPNGEVYPYDPERHVITGEAQHASVWVPYYTHYAPMEVMGALFGIRWEYNEAENIYYLSREG